MAEIKINDSGTWRTPLSVEVNDGGVWRNIQQIQVNDGGTWRTVFEYALLNTILTPADVNLPPSISGYDTGNITVGLGSIASATLAGGQTLTGFMDDNDTVGCVLYLAAASDPGVNLFSSITVNGVNKTVASRTGYGYAGGVAAWSWAGVTGLFGAGPVSLIIYP